MPVKEFTGTLDDAPSVHPFDGRLDGETSSLWRRFVADPALSAVKGAISVPEAAVGLADLATGGYAGKGAEAVGFRPKDAKAYLDTLLSPEQQEANRRVQEAEGFFPTVGAALANPSTIAHSVIESAPSMGAGGVIARGALTALPKLAPVAAGALGEGAVGAGLSAEQVRQQTGTGTLTPGQAALAAGSGAATGGLALAGGRLAQKLGITDIDTLIAGGMKEARGAGKGLARRVGEGMLTEGVFEELPQSLQEQALQNVALDKPVMEGVPEAGAMGMLAGGVMGGGASALVGKPAKPAEKPPIEEAKEQAVENPRQAAETLLSQAISDAQTGEDTLTSIPPFTPGKDPYGREFEALTALRDGTELTPQDAGYLAYAGWAKPTQDGLMLLPKGRRRLKEMEAFRAAEKPEQPQEQPSDLPQLDTAATEVPAQEAGPAEPAQAEEEISVPESGTIVPELGTMTAEGDGTRAAPVQVKTSADVEAAAQVATSDYTPPQGEANNVQRGHVAWEGLEGTIEVQAGGVRKGTNPKTGEPWETKHTTPYGYWKGTKGGDGMHVDAYFGPEIEGDHPVYVLDELNQSGKWRQHKTFVGFPSEEAAREAYLGASNKKPEQIGAITAVPKDEFKRWLKEGDTTKAFRYVKAQPSVQSPPLSTDTGQTQTVDQPVTPPIQQTPVAQDKPKTPAQRRAEKAAKAKPAPASVERFAGKYGKGLSEFVAKQQQKRLTTERPDLEWTVEAAPDLGGQMFVVAGRRVETPVVQSAVPAETSPQAEQAAVKADTLVGGIYRAAENVYSQTERRWLPASRDKIIDAINAAKAGGVEVKHRPASRPEYAEQWTITTPSGKGYLLSFEPTGRTTWHGPTTRTPAVPAKPAADEPTALVTETTPSEEDAAKIAAEKAGLTVLKSDKFAKFAPWVGNRLKTAEVKGEKEILTLGTSHDYVIYSTGQRTSFNGDGSNKGQIVGETSGDPVKLAMRREGEIIAMTSAAKKEIDARRAELETKRAETEAQERAAQEQLEKSAEARRQYFDAIGTVALPKGAKKTINVKSQAGEPLELTGTDYDGLLLHKQETDKEPYTVSDAKSGLRIAKFPRIDQAKDFIRGVIHANLPRGDLTKLSKAELEQWRQVATAHAANGELPAYFKPAEQVAEPAPAQEPSILDQPANTLSAPDLLRAAAARLEQTSGTSTPVPPNRSEATTRIEELKRYAESVVGPVVQRVYLVGSATSSPNPADTDILYELAQGLTEDTLDEAIEGVQRIDLDRYDTFIKSGDQYFHLSAGAGRSWVANNEYAKEQAGKPRVLLAEATTAREKLIADLEAKQFHGTIDRLNRGVTTEQQARNELADDTSHLSVTASKPVNPADFAAELKGKGVGRQESWSRWVQQTQLQPGMDAKDWYRIYDSVTATSPTQEPAATPAQEATARNEPQASRSAGPGITPEAARAELVTAFGEGVKSLEDSGFLVLTTSEEAPQALQDQMAGNEDAAYWNGKAYLFTDRLVPGVASNRVLHEIGEHHGLKFMLGNEAYARLQKRITAMRLGGNQAIRDAWKHVQQNYKYPEGSERFISEVIAKVGDDARVEKQAWWRELLDSIKAWLAKMGLNVRNEEDVRALLRASLNKVMREAGEPVFWRDQAAYSKGMAQDKDAAANTPTPAAAGESLTSGVGEDLVTLYHGTSGEGAEAIQRDGYIRGGSYFGVNGAAVSLTPNQRAAKDYAAGGAVLEVRVPRSALVVDPESRDDADVDAALTDGASVYAKADRIYLRRQNEPPAGDSVPAQMSRSPELIVDGRYRPVTDSTGKRLGTTEEIENFWRFFGDSKVVDDQGRPLVVYHGTKADITDFLPSAGNQHEMEGIYFTSSPSHADSYAGKEAGANVVLAYAAIENPAYDDDRVKVRGEFKAKNGRWPNPSEFTSALIGAGFDGAIVEGPFSKNALAALEMVAFRSEQIKSAIGNSGRFDPTNPDIRFSRSAALEGAIPAEGTQKTLAESPAGKAAGKWEQFARTKNRVHEAIDKLSPLGTLPEQAQYLVKRYRALGRIAKVSEETKDLYAAFRDAGEHAPNVYAYLTHKDAEPTIIKDAAIRDKAVKAKETLTAVGQQLVNQGLLAKEVFEAHKGEYLPRIYLRHLLDDDAISALSTGKKPSDMGYLKQRKDIPEDVRRLILGEITDPAYLVSKAYGTQMRDIALLDWLAEIAQERAWVMPESLVEWEGKQVTPFWLKQTAKQVRTQAIRYTEADRTEARAIADRMDETADKALEGYGGVPDGWKQIPDTPRYGRLRGLIVRSEIYDDIVGSARINPTDASVAEKVLGNGGLATKFTQLWKWSKVAANPPAQIRNFVSNGVLLHLSGVSFHMVIPRTIQAIREIRANGQHWQIAKKYGVTESTFSAQELFRIEREFLDLQARGASPLSIATAKNLASKVMAFTGDVYQLSEAVFKTAKIIDEMKKGKTEEQAMLQAQKWLFDYSLVTPSMRYLRNAPVGAPFITFYFKALPRLLEVATTHPLRLAPYLAIPYALTALLASMTDVDDDDVDKLKKALPEWLQERGNAHFLPVKDDKGRWVAMDIGYFLPWSMWQELGTELAKGEFGKAMQSSGLISGPLPDMIAAVKNNKDPFSKKEIVNEFDPPAKQIASVMGYLYSMSMPTWLTNYGFAGHMYNALNETVDKHGQVKSTAGQATLRLFGVNLYPINPEQSRADNLRRMRYEIREQKRRSTMKLRDRNLSPEDRAEIAKEYRELIQRRTKEMVKYAEESRVHPNLSTGARP